MSFKTSFQTIKEKTKEVVREASSKGSLFESWSSDSLKNLLIEYNVQLRGSKQASRRTLVRICDDLFQGEFYGKEEDFVRVYTMEQMLQIDKAVRTIQWGYIEYLQKKRQPRKLSNLIVDVVGATYNAAEHYTVHGCGEEPSYLDESKAHLEQAVRNEELHSDRQQEDEENHLSHDDEAHSLDYEESPYESYVDQQDDFESAHGGLVDEEDGIGGVDEVSREEIDDEERSLEDSISESRIGKNGSSDIRGKEAIPNNVTAPRRRSSNESKGRRRSSLDRELDTQWVKPSWKLAKKFEAESRPHRSGEDMKPYHWRKVTLGRHCTVGGCGEQLDLWDEGQMSEFAQFGSGISNYFKVRLRHILFNCVDLWEFNSI